MSLSDNVVTHRSQIPAQATAATVQTTDLNRVPFNGTLLGATMTTPAAITPGAAFRTFTLQNRKQDGTGTVVLATLTTQTVGFTANDERAMTVSAVAADLEIALDDILAMVETVTGAGVAHSGFLVQVSQDRDYNE